MGIYWIVTGSVLFASAVLFVIFSIVTIDSSTIGLVFRFGKFRRVLNPGLNFIIPILDRVEIHSTATHQFELPDEPENIDRVSEVAPPGKKLPFRVPHKGMEEAVFYVRKDYDVVKREGEPFDNSVHSLDDLKTVRFSELPDRVQEAMRADSLNAPITSEVAAVFEWNLKSKDETSIRNFIESISPEAGRDREAEVRKRAEDMVARILQEQLAVTTLGHAIFMSPFFSRLLKERLEDLVGEETLRKPLPAEKPWGIHIGDAYLKPFYPGHRVNEARADAVKSVSEKFKTIQVAEGAANATRLQADADKDKEIKKGEGEAGRIAAMAAVMADPNAKFIAELDVKERGYEAYEKNTAVTVYAPGTNAMLPLGK